MSENEELRTEVQSEQAVKTTVAPGKALSIVSFILSIVGFMNKLSMTFLYPILIDMESDMLINKLSGPNTTVTVDTTFADMVSEITIILASVIAVIGLILGAIAILVNLTKKTEAPKSRFPLVFSIIAVVISIIALII